MLFDVLLYFIMYNYDMFVKRFVGLLVIFWYLVEFIVDIYERIYYLELLICVFILVFFGINNRKKKLWVGVWMIYL